MNYAFFDFNEDEDVTIKERARKCPIIESFMGNLCVQALIDTGSEISAVSKKFYARLISERIPVPTLPTVRCYVIGVGRKRSKPISMQVLISINIGDMLFDVPCLVIEDLNHDVILGVDFLRENGGIIDFSRNVMSFGAGKEIIIQDDGEDRIDLSISSATWEGGETTKGIICQNVQKCDFLNYDERSQLQTVLLDYLHVFGRPVHPIKDFCFRIRVTDDSPFKMKNYPIPQALRGEVDETVRKMIDEGIIERSVTAYLNPIVVVKKKDGGVRICLDARRINEVTVPENEAPQNIDDILWKFNQTKIFSALDFSSSYWQIAIHPDDRKFTGFFYNGLTYVWKRMPFGLKNSGAAFIRCLDEKLGDELKRFVTPYIDDLVISSRNFQEHLCHLRRLLECLSTNQMRE